MNHLLLLAAATVPLNPSAAHVAGLIVAYLLGFAQLTNSVKWAWSWLPTKLQPVVPALVAFATDAATGLGGATSGLQIATTLLLDFGPTAAALKGALSASHFASLSPEAQAEVNAKRPLWLGLHTVTVCLAALMLCGCNATVAKDVESALAFITKVEADISDANAWLQQSEGNILALAPASARPTLQADWDLAEADYRKAVVLTGDGTNLTEDAFTKNWAQFVVDALKFESDAEQLGLYKAPGAAAPSALPAGASPPPDPPTLPLIVLHAKGQV